MDEEMEMMDEEVEFFTVSLAYPSGLHVNFDDFLEDLIPADELDEVFGDDVREMIPIINRMVDKVKKRIAEVE